MACDSPVRQCLEWHYAQRLADANIVKGGQCIRARCPVCGRKDALTISAGEWDWTIWNCFRGCDGRDVRRALLAAGVDPGCLPAGGGTEPPSPAELIAEVIRGVGSRRDWATTSLRAYAIATRRTRWPEGRDLERMAEEIGLGRTAAYAAKQAGPVLPPVRRVLPGSARPLPSTRRSARRFATRGLSATADKSAVADNEKSAVADNT